MEKYVTVVNKVIPCIYYSYYAYYDTILSVYIYIFISFTSLLCYCIY